jgi:hypothetical protein
MCKPDNLGNIYNKEENNIVSNSKNLSIINFYVNKHGKLDNPKSLLIVGSHDSGKIDNLNFSNISSSCYLSNNNEIDSKKNEIDSSNPYGNEIVKNILNEIGKNIINEKYSKYTNSVIINKFNESEDEYKELIYYPSSTKEWYNSVCSYNKAYIKPLAVLDGLTSRLFKSYLNMSELKVKNVFKRRRPRKSNYSSKKVHLSRVELKHTNNSITILLYIYNRPKFLYEQYTRKLVNFVKAKEMKRYVKSWEGFIAYAVKKNRLWYILKKRFSLFNIFNIVIFNNSFKNKLSNILKSKLSNKLKSKYSIKFKSKFFAYANKFSNLNSIKVYNNTFINKLSRLEEVFFKNAKLINFNKSKFNNLFLNFRGLGLSNILKKMYSKNIKIKIVDLKSVHLDSAVFTSAIAIKLKNRKNKALKVLRKAILNMVKIPSLHALVVNDDFMAHAEVINKNNIIDVIKQQIASGVRFEASGRLTRRLTAERAIVKRRYTGSLKDIRASYNKKPSTMLRGYIKSNLQYTIVQSKTRNGSFGLKGWLSSH